MWDLYVAATVRFISDCFFFFQAEDGIRDLVRSRGLGDVYKRQLQSGFEIQRYAAADALAAALRQAMPGAGCFGLLLSLIHI